VGAGGVVRRAERREDAVAMLRSRGYGVEVDLSPAEREGVYLEGTGVLVPPELPPLLPDPEPAFCLCATSAAVPAVCGRELVAQQLAPTPIPPGGAPRFRGATYAWLSCTRRAGRVGRVFDRLPSFDPTRQVLDRINGVAYVSLSERADAGLAQSWADQLGYRVRLSLPCLALPVRGRAPPPQALCAWAAGCAPPPSARRARSGACLPRLTASHGGTAGRPGRAAEALRGPMPDQLSGPSRSRSARAVPLCACAA